MKYLPVLSLISLLMCTTALSLAQSTEKTLVKSFNLKGNQVVELKLSGDIAVQEWNNDILRIQMVINLPNGNNAMLKSLIQAGRYSLKGVDTEEYYRVDAPNLQKKISVRGQELREHISYIVYAPTNVSVKITDTSTAALLTLPESF